MRSTYVSDHGWELRLFSLWAPFACAAGVLMGLVAFGLFVVGFYLVFFVPLAASIAVGMAIYFAVGRAHCRNLIVATIMGAMATISFFGSYYYAGMVREIGWAGAHRIDLLPLYVQARMETDVVGDVGRDNLDAQPNAMANWAMLLFEVVILGGGVILMARSAADCPYCAEQDDWMTAEIIYGRGLSIDELETKLRLGASVDVIQELRRVHVAEPGDLLLTLYYCQRVKYNRRPAPLYLYIRGASNLKAGSSVAAQKKRSSDLLELFPEEYSAAGELFNVSVNEDGSAGTAGDTPPVPFVEPLTFDSPDQTLDAKQKRQIALRSMRLWFILAPFIFIGVGLLCVFGIVQTGAAIVPFIATMAVTGILVGIGLFYEHYYRAPFVNRMLREELAAAIRRRAGALVDPDHERSWLIELLPIPSLQQVIEPHKIGFLAVDSDSGQVLMEGEDQRWQIPLDRLSPAKIMSFYDASRGEKFATLVRAVDAEERELITAIRVMAISKKELNRRRQIVQANGLAELLNVVAGLKTPDSVAT